VSSTALLVCDYIRSLSDEINYVWPAKWNFGKMLYLSIRYTVFIDIGLFNARFLNLTRNQCLVISITEIYLTSIGIMIVEAVLVLRTWIIWSRNRKIGTALVVVFVLSLTSIIILTNLGSDSRYFEAHPVVCLVSERRGFLEYVVEFILAGFETFIILITITRAVLDRRFYGPHRRMSSLLSVLYRDGE